ncbi:MAG: GIY-YIG nuclease family protein [Deinococcales bacterium]
MAILARWRRLEHLPPPKGRDAMPGVYQLANEAKHIIYIGQSARDVPNRIRQHLRNPCVAEKLYYWRYKASRIPQAEEATLIAEYRAKYGSLPPCNRVAPLERNLKGRYQERSKS